MLFAPLLTYCDIDTAMRWIGQNSDVNWHPPKPQIADSTIPSFGQMLASYDSDYRWNCVLIELELYQFDNYALSGNRKTVSNTLAQARLVT